GSGIMIAEIQQASNTTFRVYDWDRVDAAGASRPLHVEQALETIDFSRGPVDPRPPVPTGVPGAEQLAVCDKFKLDRWRLQDSHPLPDDHRFHLLAVIDGRAILTYPGGSLELPLGQTCLVPAERGPLEIAGSPAAVLLDMYLPR